PPCRTLNHPGDALGGEALLLRSSQRIPAPISGAAVGADASEERPVGHLTNGHPSFEGDHRTGLAIAAAGNADGAARALLIGLAPSDQDVATRLDERQVVDEERGEFAAAE